MHPDVLSLMHLSVCESCTRHTYIYVCVVYVCVCLCVCVCVDSDQPDALYEAVTEMSKWWNM